MLVPCSSPESLHQSWSWAVLPSPLVQLPFVKCAVKQFTLSLILDSPRCDLLNIMRHPNWSEATWSLLRQMPVTKVASLIWKIGTNRMPTSPCHMCGDEATIDHIIFSCPVSAPLWCDFDKTIKAIIAPSFEQIFGGLDRRFPDSFVRRPDSHIVSQLELLHIHFVWCAWWARQHNRDAPIERWSRRVMNLFHLLSPEAQWEWKTHPLVSDIIGSWTY